MILWINGAFGSGKTTVAEELNKRIKNSYLYDPENAGYFLRQNVPDKIKKEDNFQHIPLWREFNFKMLEYIEKNYDGTVIVPMTIYRKVYYDEIIGRLRNSGVDIKHFILWAKRDTIIKRLAERGDSENGWAARRIDVCLKAFNENIKEIMINTENITIEEISEFIIKSSSLKNI
ncbi:AAA family ATPase [Anaeropeptidivorans aminofermentans]|uniref:AAA family ATPase n=1 Tax=Anaeropeptidivorans aminofermentans TaxID=2934315 RepID=UPI00202560A1|nr:AAA family ATPase [Anaeropeptidivorans aminofermentans]